MGGFDLIDLNVVGEEAATATATLSSSAGSDSSSSVSSGSASPLRPSTLSSSVCLELWHACAGRLISLPKKGTCVVYFPQGHLELLPDYPSVNLVLPPHVFCRVTHVKIQAEVETDEVFAHVSLLPESQIELRCMDGMVDENGDEDDLEGDARHITPTCFVRLLRHLIPVLTVDFPCLVELLKIVSHRWIIPSNDLPRRLLQKIYMTRNGDLDTSTEVGTFIINNNKKTSIMHQAGQPRRHLLTIGWSSFVNMKKIASGDAVLFLRGGDGILRLGIRRAAQVKSVAPFPASFSYQLTINNFSAVVNSICAKTVFNIH